MFIHSSNISDTISVLRDLVSAARASTVRSTRLPVFWVAPQNVTISDASLLPGCISDAISDTLTLQKELTALCAL